MIGGALQSILGVVRWQAASTRLKWRGLAPPVETTDAERTRPRNCRPSSVVIVTQSPTGVASFKGALTNVGAETPLTSAEIRIPVGNVPSTTLRVRHCPRRASSARSPWVAAGVLVLLVAAGGWVHFLSSGPGRSRQPRRSSPQHRRRGLPGDRAGADTQLGCARSRRRRRRHRRAPRNRAMGDRRTLARWDLRRTLRKRAP